jgi:SAM-dependent methyltransferase
VDTLSYWGDRARRLGARAAVNLDHPAGPLHAISRGHLRRLEPLLRARLDGSERCVLDLGCGPGRRTRELAAIVGGRAIGVDPVAEMLALAPGAERVQYRLMKDGRLPAEDGEADVVFTCTVLGGILDEVELDRTSAEVERALAPGGLLFLCESVSEEPAAAYWRPRTAETYQAAFAWAELEVTGRFDDGGDPVAVLAGRAPG